VRDHRFHSFTEQGAKAFAEVLTEDGFIFVEVSGPDGRHPGWSVHGSADSMHEGLLESLAQFYGGCYEGEDLAPG
jgi:hypothetical protein